MLVNIRDARYEASPHVAPPTNTVTTDMDAVTMPSVPSTKSSKIDMRFPILLLSMLALSILMSNIVCFNFVVLFMPSTFERENINHTYIGYTKHERTLLFSSVAIGALAAVVLVSHATHAHGTRKVFFVAGLLTTVATALIPSLSRISLNWFIALRFVQGASLSAAMPTAGSITASWASLSQHGLFMSTLTTFSQVSAIFSMPVSGYLCATALGWKAVFYLHSIVSAAIFAVWYFVYRNQPSQHPLISASETATIQEGKSAADLAHCDSEGTRKKIPYLAIISTPAVWAVWVGALGDYVAVQMSAGHSSDRIVGVSETTKLRIYNSLALAVSACFLVALAFVPRGYPACGLVLLTLANAMFGFNGGGFNKCATLVSRQYSHFVMANIQVIQGLSLLISPVLVNWMLRKGSMSEWRLIFVSHGCLLLICNAVFCIFTTAKPALWTEPDVPVPNGRNQGRFGAKQVPKASEPSSKGEQNVDAVATKVEKPISKGALPSDDATQNKEMLYALYRYAV